MVKIVNPLGDVKVGRQGEAVYQRKYGEQIRRQASPKRAIASEAQIAHRQLYRDALDWRKHLSLPNRRYLDGYCISNGIVDSYHIPLAWSRFALKLYLQAIKFVPDLVVTQEPPVAGEKKDYNIFDKYAANYFGLSTWQVQTFTPLADYTIGKMAMYCELNDTPNLVTAGIRLTDGAGKPTGGDLTFGTRDASSMPPAGTPAYWYIDIAEYLLLEGVKYALVVRAPSASGTSSCNWWATHADSYYPRGEGGYSLNSGSTWAMHAYDRNFEVWSAEVAGESIKAGILHVRHPALMAVVHKREGLTVREYDTLSSLDDEYLTGQVGLDVEQGDTIEATTLPGISYSYQIN
ncbi:hypothetical protein ES703_11822 [subsurface metagenome]